MDEFAILLDRLRAIERLYNDAAGVFQDRKRKIEAAEPPYTPLPIDPDDCDGEPPFLEQWLEANEFQNVIGQSCLGLIHSCLKGYLDGVIERSGVKTEAQRFLSQRRNAIKGEGWLGKYLALFASVFSIDWGESPVATENLEEINLARNDIQHGRPAMGLNRCQDRTHAQRFPLGLFIAELDRNLRMEGAQFEWPSDEGPESFVQIHVSADALKEAISRVENFCKFVEERTICHACS